MGWNTSVVSVRAVNQISQSDLSSKLPRSHLSEIGLESQQLDRSPNSSGSLTILESLKKKKKVCWFFLFCYSFKWMGWSHRSGRQSEKEPMVGKVVVEGVALPVPASTHPSIVFNAAIQVQMIQVQIQTNMQTHIVNIHTHLQRYNNIYNIFYTYILSILKLASICLSIVFLTAHFSRAL